MNEIRPQQFTGQQSGQKPLIGGAAPKISPPKPGPGTPPGFQVESEPINLIADSEAAAAEGKIKAFAGAAGSVRRDAFARKPTINGTGACRIRSFHGRLSAQGLEYMDNQINEWLDHNPEVEVKFVTSVVGVFEGKMREPAVILNLWY